MLVPYIRPPNPWEYKSSMIKKSNLIIQIALLDMLWSFSHTSICQYTSRLSRLLRQLIS